jgi:hypothetical protein
MIKPEQENEFYRLIGMISKMSVRVNIETPYCVFFDFSGHVNLVSIRVAASKEKYHDVIFQQEFYALLGDHVGTFRDVSIGDLKRAYRFLCGLLGENANVSDLMEAA